MLGIGAITILAYWPGLYGPFLFDDYINITRNEGIRFTGVNFESIREAALSGTAGPAKRPISMLSFGVNHALSGFDEFSFKLTNLLIHVANGWLVYLLVVSLLRTSEKLGMCYAWKPEPIAVCVAAIWLLHPIQLTAVLYVVQRMTSLSAFFSLLAILSYVDVRRRQLNGRPANIRLWIAVPALTMAAVLCKENGALVPLFLLVIEVTIFRFRTVSLCARRSLDAFFISTVILPGVALSTYLLTHPEYLQNASSSRTFDVTERLLTEARVLFFYLKALYIPSLSDLGLYHDGFTVSHGIMAPPTTLLALVSVCGSILGAALLRNRLPWLAFAVLWFAAGHAIESTFVMLELVYLHRNYLPALGPILATTIGIAVVLKERRNVAIGLTILTMAVLAAATGLRAYQWGDVIRFVQFEVHHHPDSPRANFEAGRLNYIAFDETGERRYIDAARNYFERAADLEPARVSALVSLIIVNAKAGRERDPDLLHETQRRLARWPIPRTEVPALQSLTRCDKSPDCAIAPQDIAGIFGAALRNPSVNRVTRADLLSDLAIYYATRLGDVEGCIRLMQEAKALVPEDGTYRLNLVHAYIFGGDYDRAVRELQNVNGASLRRSEAMRAETYRRDLETIRQKSEQQKGLDTAAMVKGAQTATGSLHAEGRRIAT